jgi:hypothetical protein
MDVVARMCQLEDGRWSGRRADGSGDDVEAATADECLDRLLGQPEQRSAVAVEVLPRVVGVAEAASILGWDKRRVITYLDRKRFPEPLRTLASGRIWLEEDITAFANAWHARQRERLERKAARETGQAR